VSFFTLFDLGVDLKVFAENKLWLFWGVACAAQLAATASERQSQLTRFP